MMSICDLWSRRLLVCFYILVKALVLLLKDESGFGSFSKLMRLLLFRLPSVVISNWAIWLNKARNYNIRYLVLFTHLSDEEELLLNDLDFSMQDLFRD